MKPLLIAYAGNQGIRMMTREDASGIFPIRR